MGGPALYWTLQRYVVERGATIEPRPKNKRVTDFQFAKRAYGRRNCCGEVSAMGIRSGECSPSGGSSRGFVDAEDINDPENRSSEGIVLDPDDATTALAYVIWRGGKLVDVVSSDWMLHWAPLADENEPRSRTSVGWGLTLRRGGKPEYMVASWAGIGSYTSLLLRWYRQAFLDLQADLLQGMVAKASLEAMAVEIPVVGDAELRPGVESQPIVHRNEEDGTRRNAMLRSKWSDQPPDMGRARGVDYEVEKRRLQEEAD